MSGPLPPAIGGMASVLGALSESRLATQTDLTLFDTGKKTSANRSMLEGIQARLTLMKNWRALLRQHPESIAHIHTCSGFTFFLDGALLLLARWQGCRVVMHVHGARFDTFLDELNPAMLAIARFLARRANVVIALSDDWKERLHQRLPGSHIAVLPNGVPEPAGANVKAGNPRPVFVFLGNLGKRKGVPVLLDALELAQADWELEFAGGDEDAGFTAWTQNEIQQRQLSHRATVLGPVVGDAKEKLLVRADAFVLPSLAEGLPMSLLEAMAARLPVVVTSVGAMPEVITDGVEGYLVAPADAAALAKAMDNLANSASKREAMGLMGHAKFRASYSVDAMAQTLLGIYEREFGSTAQRTGR
jgi:glycosyltransferase involved in cell wall biosynthesis